VPAGAGTLASTPLPLGALHGREVVGELELSGTDSRWLKLEPLDHLIETVAMRHRIVSRRTSLVAIVEEPSVDPRAPRRRERLAVELPAGVSAEGVGLVGAGGRLNSMLAQMTKMTTGMPPAASRMRMHMFGRNSRTLDSLDVALPRRRTCACGIRPTSAGATAVRES
jgi:hypothetical protein